MAYVQCVCTCTVPAGRQLFASCFVNYLRLMTGFGHGHGRAELNSVLHVRMYMPQHICYKPIGERNDGQRTFQLQVLCCNVLLKTSWMFNFLWLVLIGNVFISRGLQCRSGSDICALEATKDHLGHVNKTKSCVSSYLSLSSSALPWLHSNDYVLATSCMAVAMSIRTVDFHRTTSSSFWQFLTRKCHE